MSTLIQNYCNNVYNFLWHWTVGNLFRDSHNFEANNGGLTLTLLAVKEMDINYDFTCNDNEVEVEVGLKNNLEFFILLFS